MESVRHIIDGHLLTDIIPLPQYFFSRKLEVIVMPTEEVSEKPLFTKSEIDDMLSGSVAESLVGAVPDSGRTLEEYRTERLGKYV